MRIIDAFAFSDCEEIKSIVLPNSIEELGVCIFSDCVNLAFVTLPSQITTVPGYMFSGCESLTSIEFLHNKITQIGSGAFSGCLGLTELTIPNKIHAIDLNAFAGCINLETVIITKNVSYIGFDAFAKNGKLKDVYCAATEVPTASKDTFSDSYIENAILHVPASSISEYKKVKPWSDFGLIVSLSQPGTGILDATINLEESCIYTTYGVRVNTLQKGVNIIRTTDGQTKKVYVK